MHIVGETGNTEIAELLMRYGALTDLQNEVCTLGAEVNTVVSRASTHSQVSAHVTVLTV